MTEKPSVESAAERILALEAELESAGDVHAANDELTQSRAVLQTWVETVVGVVCSPGVGRVTLIHANGNQSKIASPDLPFLLSRPATFKTREDETR